MSVLVGVSSAFAEHWPESDIQKMLMMILNAMLGFELYFEILMFSQ
jgi:hypothetical protein